MVPANSILLSTRQKLARNDGPSSRLRETQVEQETTPAEEEEKEEEGEEDEEEEGKRNSARGDPRMTFDGF